MTSSLSVSWWYKFFLEIPVDFLKKYIDLYNQDALTPNARAALEAINSID